MQLGGRHGEHFSTGFEILIWDGKSDPELVASAIGIDAGANDEPGFYFFLRLQEADIIYCGLVVERKASAFPTVIDGDLVAVDGFDNPVKGLTRFLLIGNSVRWKDQENGDGDECQVYFHGIDLPGKGYECRNFICICLASSEEKQAATDQIVQKIVSYYPQRVARIFEFTQFFSSLKAVMKR